MSGAATPHVQNGSPTTPSLDISGDSYVHKHESGSLECKLCLTVHTSANSYLTHAQGRRHQQNIDRQRPAGPSIPEAVPLKKFEKIGLPRYDIIKVRDPQTLALGIRVELQYPQIKADVKPRFRMMSAFEQQIEDVNTKYQYLVIAAEPYETVALRIPANPLDEETLWSYFDEDTRVFTLQFLFRA